MIFLVILVNFRILSSDNNCSKNNDIKVKFILFTIRYIWTQSLIIILSHVMWPQKGVYKVQKMWKKNLKVKQTIFMSLLLSLENVKEVCLDNKQFSSIDVSFKLRK